MEVDSAIVEQSEVAAEETSTTAGMFLVLVSCMQIRPLKMNAE